MEPSVLKLSRPVRYLIALLSVCAALALHSLLYPIVERVPALLFIAAVAFSTGYGGRGPGLLAVVLSIIAIDVFVLPPIGDFSLALTDVGVLFIFTFVALFIGSVYERSRYAADELQQRRETYRVMLSSISDGVIATDAQGRITFVNGTAETLTGWTAAEALGRSIQEVFAIINETTRTPIENPVARVLREGSVVGLSNYNYSVLIARDGVERPIDDSGAPIRDEQGAISGAVLTFRDVSEQRHAQKTAALAADRVSRLQAFTAALSEAITLAQVAQVAVEQSYPALDNAQGALLTLLEPATRRFNIVSSMGYPQANIDHWQQLAFDADLSVMEMLKNKLPLFIENTKDWETRYPKIYKAVISPGLAVLPLHIDDAILGSLLIGFSSIRTFSPEDRAFLETLARQCAQAIYRAQLFEAERLAREQLSNVLGSISDGFVTFDRDLRYTFVNDRAEQITKRPRAELLGRHVTDIFDVPGEYPFEAYVRRALAEQTVLSYEEYTPFVDAWLSVRLYPFRDGVALYVQDVTERHKTETALRISELRLKTFIDANIIGIILGNNDGSILDANDTFLQMIGYTREDLGSGKISWLTMTPPEYLSRDQQAVDEALATGHTSSYEKEYFRKDGSRVPIYLGGVLVEGTWLTFVIDMSDRKRAENRLRLLTEVSAVLSSSLDYEQTLSAITRQVVPAMAGMCTVRMLQADGSVQLVAVAHKDPSKLAWITEMLRRYTPDLQAAQGVGLLMRSGQSILYEDVSDEMLVRAARSPEELAVLRQVGYTSRILVPLLSQGTPIGVIELVATEGGPRYTADDLAFAEDLARRASSAIENARLYQQAQNALRERDAFLSVAAHELKTPITSLRGFAQILMRQLKRQGTFDPATLEQALITIDAQSLKLSALINALLDLSRLEAGRLRLERQPTDLVKLTADAIATVQQNTVRHTLTLSAPPTLIAAVDPLRFEQVLVNLLDNAIKYSPDGGTIDIELVTFAIEDVEWASLSVRDYGLGIPKERRAQIFDRFYQAHREGYLGGMGLGLYISREIVEMHDARIEASFPDKGSKFTVMLPLVTPITAES